MIADLVSALWKPAHWILPSWTTKCYITYITNFCLKMSRTRIKARNGRSNNPMKQWLHKWPQIRWLYKINNFSRRSSDDQHHPKIAVFFISSFQFRFFFDYFFFICDNFFVLFDRQWRILLRFYCCFK